MPEPPSWARSGILYLAIVVEALLVLQYALGLWTNVYGVGLNAAGLYTSSSSGSTYSAHVDLGYLLGLLSLLIVILAALHRQARVIAQSVFLLLWIGIAGVTGRLFVTGSPNPAIDSFLMGLAFLFAFGTGIGLVVTLLRARTTGPAAPPAGAPPAPAGSA